MLKPEIEQALNAQLNQEQGAAHEYLGTAAWFAERNLGGFASFMRDQAREERDHAMRIFDYVLDTAWMIADSNHGFKMIGVGKLTAEMMVQGQKPDELKPFTMARYSDGTTFGDRNSNCPWV